MRKSKFTDEQLAFALNQALQWLDKVQEAVLNVRALHTILDRATAGDVRDAYAHICRASEPLSPVDVDEAVCWASATV